MKLIEDWKKGLKFLSVQVSLLASACASAWLIVPETQRSELLSLLPFDLGGKGPALMVLFGFISVIAARLKAQPGLEKKADK